MIIQILDSPAIPARGGSPFTVYKNTLRKLMMKLVLTPGRDILPASLILTGVVLLSNL